MQIPPLNLDKIYYLLQQSRYFLYLLIRQFRRDHCHQATAALTYTTLLAIVPLLAVGLVLFHKLPFYTKVQHEAQLFILQVFAPEIGQDMVQAFFSFIENAGKLTGISSIVLLFTAMMTLNTIDLTLNHIWKVERGRRTVINLLIYFVVVVTGPLLVGTSIVITAYLISITHLPDGIQDGWLTWFPLTATFLAFTAFYRWVPNTHVAWRYAISSGLVAAVLFEIAKRGFALYISRFPTYETIYGAMALVPLMLVWIYLSWLVILIGAETGHCLALMQRGLGDLHAQRSLLLPFRVLGLVYLAGPDGCTLNDIAAGEQLSTVRIQSELERLTRAELIIRGADGVYILANQVHVLTLAEIFDLLEERLLGIKD
ncbi:MAG: YihY family inner membrane protein [Gammaproteobacteria bacterium]|nr:YihY family inner membrane protein [Gammaproteobacteria bacterium]MDH5650968.1 YihY family inner membrane protein [Gammaproteobacteria bacterium]